MEVCTCTDSNVNVTTIFCFLFLIQGEQPCLLVSKHTLNVEVKDDGDTRFIMPTVIKVSF